MPIDSPSNSLNKPSPKERFGAMFLYLGDGRLIWKERTPATRVNKRLNLMFAGTEAGARYRKSSTGYKTCRICISGKHYTRSRIVWVMHHGDIPNGMMIDHINRDSWDDRIENLRLASREQNARNRKFGKNSTSGYKGVSASKGRWRADIKVGGKQIVIGCFGTRFAAALAYDERASQLHGEFASLNFPKNIK